MLDDLKELLRIQSVLAPAPPSKNPDKKAPFGEGNRKALDWFLQKAASFGLKTGELDGYCGWAEYGDGQECVAALCHLDVVPAGEGWIYPAYDLTQKDGRLYGRGVVDNKGAAIMCLHALKEIKDAGVKTARRIRIIVGLNEEHGSACIKHYVSISNSNDIPKLAFVPDSEFPVINSEKGIMHFSVILELDAFFEENIAFISGGGSINVIPDRACVSIFKDSPLGRYIQKITDQAVDNKLFLQTALVGAILASGAKSSEFNIKTEAEVFTIEASGVSGHAMAPHKGDNAVWKIITVLDAFPGTSTILEFFKNYIATPLAAEALGIFRDDPQSGNTTINMGIIEFDAENNLRFTLDIRLPVTLDGEAVKKSLSNALPKGAKLEVLRHAPNLFIDKDDPFIKTLLDVYEEKTGDEGYCIKTGGGTYARELPCAVAFGPMFSGKDGLLHKPDENMEEADFFKAYAIYKEALERLGRID